MLAVYIRVALRIVLTQNSIENNLVKEKVDFFSWFTAIFQNSQKIFWEK